jgi:pyroglutamyl-peptidase
LARARTILITGFGPFPGAPFNPTQALVRSLARMRHPGLGDCRIVGHVFPTSYAAVDRELPALMKQYRPDAVVMFGLAARSPGIRIETIARNAIMARRDVSAAIPPSRFIDAKGPPTRPLRAPLSRLLRAARASGLAVEASRDAGRYVCNYTFWRGLEHAAAGGPALAVFVHVPKTGRGSRPAGAGGGFTSEDLYRAGRAIVLAVAAALRRPVPALLA